MVFRRFVDINPVITTFKSAQHYFRPDTFADYPEEFFRNLRTVDLCLKSTASTFILQAQNLQDITLRGESMMNSEFWLEIQIRPGKISGHFA